MSCKGLIRNSLMKFIVGILLWILPVTWLVDRSLFEGWEHLCLPYAFHLGQCSSYY